MKGKAIASLIAAVAIVAGIVSVVAASPRVPQVPVTPPDLQNYFTSMGQTINVLTDQEDIQCWSTTVSNNATFTLQVELTAALAPLNSFGIYNCAAGAPALYQVFSGAATAGWFAVASFFASGNLVVNVFDQNAALMSSTTYVGVDRFNFGFYLSNPGGTFYSQDARNGGFPQALVYAGTGTSAGQWWLAWEDLPYLQSDLDFNDMVLFLESVNPPVPVENVSWGSIKARFAD